MRRGSRSPARLLAPLSLIAFAIAFVIVLSSSGVSSKDGAGRPSGASTTSPAAQPRPKFARRRTYTVRAGDTLGAIALKTGVSVTTLEDLNPGLDPQSLVAGQKIKLRQ